MFYQNLSYVISVAISRMRFTVFTLSVRTDMSTLSATHPTNFWTHDQDVYCLLSENKTPKQKRQIVSDKMWPYFHLEQKKTSNVFPSDVERTVQVMQ